MAIQALFEQCWWRTGLLWRWFFLSLSKDLFGEFPYFKLMAAKFFTKIRNFNSQYLLLTCALAKHIPKVPNLPKAVYFSFREVIFERLKFVLKSSQKFGAQQTLFFPFAYETINDAVTKAFAFLHLLILLFSSYNLIRNFKGAASFQMICIQL